jgi:glycosyltransferase involved in cell wall biosynthesis
MIGGIETVILNQAKYFTVEGNKVTVFETLKKGPWVDYFLRNNIEVISLVPDPLYSKKRHALKIAENLREYEVILLHDAPYAQSILGLLPERTVAIPVLHSSPESMIYNSISNPGQWNKLVYVNPYLKDLLLGTHKINEEQIKNIPNGIEIPIEGKSKAIIKKTGKKFLFIGRLEHTEKAVLYIPDIIKKVLLKQSIEVVNIYGGGSSYKALKYKIEQLSLGEIIKLHGPVEHQKIYDILWQHDFLIMPSFFEGHPVVLLEAMACKTIPFVSNLCGRTDFVVEHGINGFLCNPADIEDFSAKIIETLGRTDLEIIAERARATVIKKFSIKEMGNSYLELIKDEINKKHSIKRPGRIYLELLGDMPSLPIFMIRPIRKILRILHLWKEKYTKS